MSFANGQGVTVLRALEISRYNDIINNTRKVLEKALGSIWQIKKGETRKKKKKTKEFTVTLLNFVNFVNGIAWFCLRPFI